MLSTTGFFFFPPWLSPRILQALWELPDWVCLPNLLPIFEQPDAVTAIRKTFGGLLWGLSFGDRRGVIESLRYVRSVPELLTTLSRCKVRLLSKEPFPPPPIPGDRSLVPLRSAAEMRREAREMRNCLYKMIEEVFGGCVFLFVGAARNAPVLVIGDGTRLAHLEIKGRSNAAVPEATVSEIRALVEDEFSNPAQCGDGGSSVAALRTPGRP